MIPGYEPLISYEEGLFYRRFLGSPKDFVIQIATHPDMRILVKDIYERMGGGSFSKESIERALEELEELGFIKKVDWMRVPRKGKEDG